MVKFVPFSITVQGRLVAFNRPAVMGILNATADSFYDGGRYVDDAAIAVRARSIVADGADIVDVGVSSTRPGSALPSPDDEAPRLAAVVRVVREAVPQAVISVDTCFALSAAAAVEAGADMVNDIGGGDLDSGMFATVAGLQVPYIMMHGARLHFGHDKPAGGEDLIDSVVRFFSARLDTLYRLGAKDVWIDPGFGFGKGVRGDHELLRRLDELTTLFREPLLAAMSRKSMLCKPLGITPDEALEATVAADALALDRGARIVRVHDVRPAVQTVCLTMNTTTS